MHSTVITSNRNIHEDIEVAESVEAVKRVLGNRAGAVLQCRDVLGGSLSRVLVRVGWLSLDTEAVLEMAVDGPIRVETTLVGLPPDEDRSEIQTFLTNLVVDGEIGLDRRQTRRKIKRYTRRGDIENAYGSIKQFAPWTTLKDYAVRLFHFGFAMLLYDMWLLVDLLVQLSLGVVEFRTKPRGDDPRFRGFLQRRLITLL